MNKYHVSLCVSAALVALGCNRESTPPADDPSTLRDPAFGVEQPEGSGNNGVGGGTTGSGTTGSGTAGSGITGSGTADTTSPNERGAPGSGTAPPGAGSPAGPAAMPAGNTSGIR